MRPPGKPRDSRITRRGLILIGAQLAVVGGLGARMRHLQVQEAAKYRLLAEENRLNIRLIPPERGLLMDRNGTPLAENRQNYRIVMVREQAGDAEAVLRKLARIIDLPPDRQEKVLKEMRQRSAFVPVTVAEHLSWSDLSRVAVNAPALPGVLPQVGLTRYYPQKHATAHIVGYVGPVSDRDLQAQADPDPLLQIPDFQIGKTGIEVTMEPELRGAAGASQIEVNAVGRVMREIEHREGTPGRDMHLTLDTDLQNYALDRMEGQSAATVLMDVQTGEVLASASAPSFDPNDFVFGISFDKWNELLENPYRPLPNKVISGAYPPGSTFKMVVALAAVEGGHVGADETVYCPGFYQMGNRRFHCWRTWGHGKMNLREAIKNSCDVYFYEISQRTGIDAIGDMAIRLGMGVKPDLPVPAVSPGLIPTRTWKKQKYDDDWRDGDTLNSGIGQGFVLASPLQLAVMTARIATGRMVEPRLIRAIDGSPMDHPEPAELVVNQTALRLVREGMYQVVNDRRGTAYSRRIADPENQMAGKTGTSQVRIITPEERAQGVFKNEDLPWERRDHGLFVCYAPYDNPKYALATVVEHGGGGSSAAAPIARDVMMRALYGPEPPLAAYPPAEREEIERAREEQTPASSAPTETLPPINDRV